MDPCFSTLLRKYGITRATISVLEQEVIVTRDVFMSLGEKHLDSLLPQVKLGQHALLLEIWKEEHGEKKIKVSLNIQICCLCCNFIC